MMEWILDGPLQLFSASGLQNMACTLRRHSPPKTFAQQINFDMVVEMGVARSVVLLNYHYLGKQDKRGPKWLH